MKQLYVASKVPFICSSFVFMEERAPIMYTEIKFMSMFVFAWRKKENNFHALSTHLCNKKVCCSTYIRATAAVVW